jgi:beta-galactosidase
MRNRITLFLLLFFLNSSNAEHRLDYSCLSLPLPDSQDRLSLNGPWKFKLLPEGAVVDPQMADPGFDDSDWALVGVPSNWEMQGFEPPRYARPSNTSAWYRTRFRVPKDWQQDRIVLRFDGVLYALEVWVNGQRVGEWSSAYQPVQFDVSLLVKNNAINHVAVHVTKRPPAYEFDCNDAWALSGIYRDVTIYRLPENHFSHLHVETHLFDDESAQLKILYKVAGQADRIKATLYDPAGHIVDKQMRAIDSSLIFETRNVLFWNAETPNLYALTLQLYRDDKLLHSIEQPVGFRQVRVEDSVLLINGKAVKLRGTCRHEIHPEVGRALREEHWWRDLELMKRAHINMIRTSHYPPHPRLLELCDQLGMYVICEVPFGFGDQHLTDPAFQEELLTRANATVRRDQNHPCVIIWSVGNENPYTPLVEKTVLRVKELDPSRPVCIPQENKDFVQEGFHLPDFVDILAPHYPVPDQLRSFLQQTQRPMILTEYSHSLGLAAEGAASLWKIILENENLAGGALWVWSDQGIRRRDTEDQFPDKGPSQAVWLDRNTVLDSDGQSGTDGLVYANRMPHVDYWQIRHIYSPVQIEERQLVIESGQKKLEFTVHNRYDFLSLEQHNLDYLIVRDNQMLVHDVIPLSALAGQTETMTLPADLPAPLGNHDYRMEIRILDNNRRSMHNVTIELEHEQNLAERLLSKEVNPFVRVKDQTFEIFQDPIKTLIDRQSGRITITGLNDPLLLDSAPLLRVSRKPTMAEQRIKRRKWQGDFYWQPPTLASHLVQSCEIDTSGTVPVCRMQLRYVRPDSEEQVIELDLNLTFQRNGGIDADYDLDFSQVSGVFLELGLAFEMPEQMSEFRWLGLGPYASYPAKWQINQRGLYHLNGQDLRFQGNRRDVDLALFTDSYGNGVAWVMDHEQVGVERHQERIVMSHNLVVSGRGTKVNPTQHPVMAAELEPVRGHFLIVPLTGQEWSMGLRSLFGDPGDRSEPFNPFAASYDQ